jgi:hypothetical protein
MQRIYGTSFLESSSSPFNYLMLVVKFEKKRMKIKLKLMILPKNCVKASIVLLFESYTAHKFADGEESQHEN